MLPCGRLLLRRRSILQRTVTSPSPCWWLTRSQQRALATEPPQQTPPETSQPDASKERPSRAIRRAMYQVALRSREAEEGVASTESAKKQTTQSSKASKKPHIFLQLRDTFTDLAARRDYSPAASRWRFFLAQFLNSWRGDSFVRADLVLLILLTLAAGPEGAPMAKKQLDWMQKHRRKEFQADHRSVAAVDFLLTPSSVTPERIRNFFGAISTKNTPTIYTLLVDALLNAQRPDHARAVMAELYASGMQPDLQSVSTSLRIVLAILTAPHSPEQHKALLGEAEGWWARAKEQHTQLLNGGAVLTSLLAIHRLGGEPDNLQRQFALLEEALALEAQTSPPLVYITPACLRPLSDAFAVCPNPAQWARQAERFFNLAMERATATRDAGANTSDPDAQRRALLLGLNGEFFNAWLTLYVRWDADHDPQEAVVNGHRIWAHMEAAGVRPASGEFTALLCVYITARYSHYIDSLVARLPKAGVDRTAIKLATRDYSRLFFVSRKMDDFGLIARWERMATKEHVKLPWETKSRAASQQEPAASRGRRS